MPKPLHVLVVEDVEIDVELIANLLQESGYLLSYEWAHCASTIQSALSRKTWDVVLGDSNIKALSHFDLEQVISQLAFSCTPLVIISSVVHYKAPLPFSQAEDLVYYLPKTRLAQLAFTIEEAITATRQTQLKEKAAFALKESEERYRQIIETTLEGVWILDEYHKTRYVNRQMAEMLDYQPEQMIGRDLLEFIGQETKAAMPLNAQGGAPDSLKHYEFHFLRQDGSTLWGWVSLSPVFDNQGRYHGVVAMVTDITGRKAVEDALRESEARFRNMADVMPVGIAITQQSGELIYANPACSQFLGQSFDQLKQKHWMHLVHPEDRQGLRAQHEVARLNKESYSYECRVCNGDGLYSWIYMLTTPRKRGDGRLEGFITCAFDLSIRKGMEEALKRNLEKEKLTHRLMENNTQMMDFQRVLDFTAQELASYLKVDGCCLSASVDTLEVQGENSFLCVYPNESPTLHCLAKRIMPMSQARYIEKNHAFGLVFNSDMPEDDSYAWLQSQGVGAALIYDIFSHGTQYGRLALFQFSTLRQWTRGEIEIVESVVAHLGENLHQITLSKKERLARQRLEESYKLLALYTKQIERSNLELEHFATIASHDLRGPLRKSMAFSEMLSDLPALKQDEQAKDYLARMQRALYSMQNLVTDLLDLSCIHRKGKPFGLISLQEVVRQALEDFQEQFVKVNATVSVEIAFALEADDNQLKQVFSNLIENSLKFTRPGVPLQLSIQGSEIDDEYCLIKVEDNGIGIEAEHYEKVFEVFTRLNSAQHYPGTGIGLSVVKKIIERHKGSIEISSIVGEGTAFFIQLPLRHVQADRMIASAGNVDG